MALKKLNLTQCTNKPRRYNNTLNKHKELQQGLGLFLQLWGPNGRKAEMSKVKSTCCRVRVAQLTFLEYRFTFSS